MVADLLLPVEQNYTVHHSVRNMSGALVVELEEELDQDRLEPEQDMLELEQDMLELEEEQPELEEEEQIRGRASGHDHLQILHDHENVLPDFD